MEEKFTTAPKEVLVQLVKLAQKKHMKGDKGDWKEFLKVFDKKFGASMSDPTKRTPEVLRAFLNTFQEEKDIQFFERRLHNHEKIEKVKQLLESGQPEESLIILTLGHPQYAMEYTFPSDEEGWVVTKPGKKSKKKPSNSLLAVDCEMVLCADGTEALVKICVVDRNFQVKLHEFVNPGKEVADYRTHVTGVSAADLDGITRSLRDIQKFLKKLLSHGTILVGHSLSNDLKAMKLDHARVIDTSYIFKAAVDSSKRRPSLNDLCKTVLGYELRKEMAPHNCVDDACAAMKLVLAKIEHGFNAVIPVKKHDVPDSEKAKLLVHNIPKDLPSEELFQLISGDFTIETQTSKKIRGDKYSAFAIFGSPQAALDSFESLQGDEVKDSFGLPQKTIPVELKSGLKATIYVRKMACDIPVVPVTGKRPHLTETPVGELKRLKIEQSTEPSAGDPVKEVERLKNLLNQRDQEISSLHKIVAALTRKQGL